VPKKTKNESSGRARPLGCWIEEPARMLLNNEHESNNVVSKQRFRARSDIGGTASGKPEKNNA